MQLLKAESQDECDKIWKSVTGDLKLMGYHLPFQWATERYSLMKWRRTKCPSTVQSNAGPTSFGATALSGTQSWLMAFKVKVTLSLQ